MEYHRAKNLTRLAVLGAALLSSGGVKAALVYQLDVRDGPANNEIAAAAQRKATFTFDVKINPNAPQDRQATGTNGTVCVGPQADWEWPDGAPSVPPLSSRSQVASLTKAIRAKGTWTGQRAVKFSVIMGGVVDDCPSSGQSSESNVVTKNMTLAAGAAAGGTAGGRQIPGMLPGSTSDKSSALRRPTGGVQSAADRLVAPGVGPVTAAAITTAMTWISQITAATLGSEPDPLIKNKTISDIINNAVTGRADGLKCNACHNASSGKYRAPAGGITPGTRIPRGDGSEYQWNQTGPTGIVERFRNSPIGKPAHLKALFKKWADNGYRQ